MAGDSKDGRMAGEPARKDVPVESADTAPRADQHVDRESAGSRSAAAGNLPDRNAEPPPGPTIAILDDDPSVLRGIGRLLRHHGFEVITYTAPAALLDEIESVNPHCLVVDLAMPELSGLDVQRLLSAKRVNCPAVFVTGHGDIRTSVQAMRGGAVDFLVKPFDANELLDALGRAIARHRHASELGDRLAATRSHAALLTTRERQVFEQVAAGLLNKQIAANLGISEKTVKVHRSRVMRKMGLRSVAQLVRAADCLHTDEGP